MIKNSYHRRMARVGGHHDNIVIDGGDQSFGDEGAVETRHVSRACSANGDQRREKRMAL